MSLANSYSARISHSPISVSSYCYPTDSNHFPSPECWSYIKFFSGSNQNILCSPWQHIPLMSLRVCSSSLGKTIIMLLPNLVLSSSDIQICCIQSCIRPCKQKFFYLASHPIRLSYHCWLHPSTHSSLPSNIFPALQNCIPRSMQQSEIAGQPIRFHTQLRLTEMSWFISLRVGFFF